MSTDAWANTIQRSGWLQVPSLGAGGCAGCVISKFCPRARRLSAGLISSLGSREAVTNTSQSGSDSSLVQGSYVSKSILSLCTKRTVHVCGR